MSRAPQAWIEAGRRNLAAYNERVSEGKVAPGSLRHGVFSKAVKNTYSDPATPEGAAINNAIRGFADDLGGFDVLTTAQTMMLDRLRELLVIMGLMGRHVDSQPDVIVDGELIPILKQSYVMYLGAFSRTIRDLYDLSGRRRPNQATLKDVIAKATKAENGHHTSS